MSEPLEQISLELTSSAAASPARIYPWRDAARAWMESGVACGSSSIAFLKSLARAGASSRTCPAFFPGADVWNAVHWRGFSGFTRGSGSERELRRALCALPHATSTQLIRAAISRSSSPAWSRSGMASHGGCWTLSTPAWPNDASVSSLSEVLETEVPSRYFLSQRACAGILRRAARRGKDLPSHLARALEAVAGMPETHGTPISSPPPCAPAVPGPHEPGIPVDKTP